MIKKTLTKGEYYIGDPCYIFDESWDDVLDKTSFFNNNETDTYKGKVLVAGNTKYGDGTYIDDDGKMEFFVDAGLIGITEVSMLEIDNKYTKENIENSSGMHIVEFEEDFEVEISEGRFRFGHIFIDTEGSDDEWDENDDYEWDEDEHYL